MRPPKSAGNESFRAALALRLKRNENETPPFFQGYLWQAIYAAFRDQDRPLALYIHHDGSIASYIFPEQVLCSNEVMELLRGKFVCWPWDVTTDDNKKMLKKMLDQSGIASSRLADFPMDNYPLLALLTKEGGKPKVLHIVNCDVVSKLYDTIEDFENAEAREEQEKKAREAKRREKEKMKEEQNRKESDRRAKLKASLPREPADRAPGTILLSLYINTRQDTFMRRFSRSMPLSVFFTFLESEGMPSDLLGLSPGDGMQEWDPSTTLGEIVDWNKAVRPGCYK